MVLSENALLSLDTFPSALHCMRAQSIVVGDYGTMKIVIPERTLTIWPLTVK